MNDTGTRILRHLMEDGRKSNVEVAKAIGVSEETVCRRRASFQRDEVYEIVAVLAYRKLGYGFELLLGIEADESQIEEIARVLAKLNEVYRLLHTAGSFNMFAWLTVCSMMDVDAVLREKVRNIPGIGRVVIFCCLETTKEWTPTGPWASK